MGKNEALILSLIGKTPLVRLRRLEHNLGLSAKLYAKLEMFNPSGSVKDRTALWIIRSAFIEGKLAEGGTVVEATSGNMGISLSMLSNIYNFKAKIIMPRGMSDGRKRLIRAYGGELLLTDGGMTEAMRVAEEISETLGAFMPRQFTNLNGMLAHLETGREIWYALHGEKNDGTSGGVGWLCSVKEEDCTVGGAGQPDIQRKDDFDLGVPADGTMGGAGRSCSVKEEARAFADGTVGGGGLCSDDRDDGATNAPVDIFVSGVGTGGTIGGAGRFLKSKNPRLHIVAVEPSESAVLSGKPKGNHGIEGIGAGFLPPLFDTGLVDEILAVSTEEAGHACRLLMKNEGIFAGISSGAAVFAAINLAKREENRCKSITVILPDSGEKYL